MICNCTREVLLITTGSPLICVCLCVYLIRVAVSQGHVSLTLRAKQSLLCTE